MPITLTYVGSPNTSFDEAERQQAGAMSTMPSVNEGIRITNGQISEIHDTKPWVRVVTKEGTPIANGNWVPLSHTVDEIVERFGTIRKGMRVSVTHTGPEGSQALATIVGLENEEKHAALVPKNTVKKGLYAIFTPGVGV